MNTLEVYSPERIAAIRAALAAFPDRRGALRKILYDIVIISVSKRANDPVGMLREIRITIESQQDALETVRPPPDHADDPFPSRDPFLDFLLRILDTPIDAHGERAAAAARLLAIADVALALFRFKGKAWE